MSEASELPHRAKPCWTLCAVVNELFAARDAVSGYEEQVVSRTAGERDSRVAGDGDSVLGEEVEQLRLVGEAMREYLRLRGEALGKQVTQTVVACPGPLELRKTVEDTTYVTYVCQSRILPETQPDRLPTFTFVHPPPEREQ